MGRLQKPQGRQEDLQDSPTHVPWSKLPPRAVYKDYIGMIQDLYYRAIRLYIRSFDHSLCESWCMLLATTIHALISLLQAAMATVAKQ